MKIISRKTVWQGFVRLEELQVELADGTKASREVHDHGNASCVLPVDHERDKLLLVRQMRPGVMSNRDPAVRQQTPFLEIVAGLIDPGEDPLETARREALEETGFAVHGLEKIAEAYASPGTVTEYVFIYAGQYDSRKPVHEGGGLASEGENIEVVELTIDEVRQMLKQGEIRDAKTLIALNWLFCRDRN